MPPQSPKAITLQAIVKKQFTDNKDELDQQKVHKMKQACVLASNSSRIAPCALFTCTPVCFHSAERCLSNYFLYEKTQTDPKLREAAKAHLEFKGWDLSKMLKPDEDDPDYDIDAAEANDPILEGEEEEGKEEASAPTSAPIKG